MAEVTCKHCKNKIDRDTSYKVGKASYYCNEECYNKAEQSKKEKHKSTDGSQLSYKNYIQSLYLSNGYSKSQLGSSFWQLIMKQTGNILKEHNTKYSALEYTLRYMVEVKGMNLFSDEYDGTILNLVGYHIDEAKQYYFDCQSIKQAVKEFNFDDNVIVVKKSKSSGNRLKEININEL